VRVRALGITLTLTMLIGCGFLFLSGYGISDGFCNT
jgi:hypothetical protein